MQRKAIRKRKLSVFSYFFIFVFIVILTVLTVKELDISSGIEEILYQKDINSNVEQENKYYINKIKNEYGIVIGYGEEEKSFLSSVNANAQYDINIVNNNIKIIYNALKKYPSDVFDIFKEEKYSLYIILVSNFNDNNLALASKNTLNQYRIFLSNNEDFERAFHHEFFHVLEYYMSDKVKYLYYAWNSYNPTGFGYEKDISKLTDEFVYSRYLTETENENAYFISKYSKVSAKEDRAEIFAELMMLNKKEGYLKNGTHIKYKISYLINEIYENVSISNFHFSSYLN
jgi:hypothetical protein